MAKQRSSFAKLQRDKAKKERAARKRADRLDRKDEGEVVADAKTEDVVEMVSGDGAPSPDELLNLVEDLHQRRAAGTISEDDFEEAKIELFARLQAS